ncbi:RNA polymerase sigma factor [Solimonas soli]|uniref:RNA polymerase sigma factor n=1 Tax=Solimonas soli TaxID=413479 RepID=UPI0004847B5F|nr:RNA polymerase sigma factor [Solimonas soli]
MKPATETALIAALVESYEALVDRLRWRFASHNEARDVVHDACLKLLEAPPQAAIRNPQAFLQRVATHLAIDHHRIESGRRRLLPLDAGADVEQAPVSGPEEACEGEQTLRALLAAIGDLPPRCRDVFILHKLNDVPQREIARRLGISQNMVAKHIMRAMQTLRPLIDADSRP